MSPSNVVRLTFAGGALLAGLAVTTLAAGAALPGFRQEGTRWSYTDGQTTMSGVLFKPDGDGPFPALLISHGRGGNAEEFGASEENLRRARKCLDILASLPYVDANRLAAYGNSMGAFITVALGAQESARLQAAAITAGGVSTRTSFATEAQAENARVPLCILHGTADGTVPPSSSVKLKEILDRNHVPNERHTFEGIGHNLHQDRAAECRGLMRAWFKQRGVLKE